MGKDPGEPLGCEKVTIVHNNITKNGDIYQEQLLSPGPHLKLSLLSEVQAVKHSLHLRDTSSIPTSDPVRP